MFVGVLHHKSVFRGQFWHMFVDIIFAGLKCGNQLLEAIVDEGLRKESF